MDAKPRSSVLVAILLPSRGREWRLSITSNDVRWTSRCALHLAYCNGYGFRDWLSIGRIRKYFANVVYIFFLHHKACMLQFTSEKSSERERERKNRQITLCKMSKSLDLPKRLESGPHVFVLAYIDLL